MKNLADNEIFSQKVMAWQAILDDVKFEHIRLKNLLADAVSKNVSRRFVEEAEMFQQKFLDKEQVADLLRHDISAITGDKGDWNPGKLQQLTSLERDIDRLQSEIENVKDLFYQLLESKAD